MQISGVENIIKMTKTLKNERKVHNKKAVHTIVNRLLLLHRLQEACNYCFTFQVRSFSCPHLLRRPLRYGIYVSGSVRNSKTD